MKSKIIEQLKQRGYTAVEGEKILAAVSQSIVAVAKAEPKNGARVPGMGTFKVKPQAARKARNPRTGETMQIAERKALKFKEANDLIL
ncbi:MAG: HU family DNA-binding protein [Rhizorhabdus sp.]